MAEFDLRERLVTLLEGHGAHISFGEAIDGFPSELIDRRVESLAHTMWQLVYHLRITQWDILDFIENPDHRSPSYPSGLWPDQDGPQKPADWDETIAAFGQDLERMKELVLNPDNDLFQAFPHGSGHNLFHEAITLGDHNSYHIGQVVDLRMLLGVPVKDW